MAIQVIRNEIVSNVIKELTLHFQSTTTIAEADVVEGPISSSSDNPEEDTPNQPNGISLPGSPTREGSRGAIDVDESIRSVIQPSHLRCLYLVHIIPSHAYQRLNSCRYSLNEYDNMILR